MARAGRKKKQKPTLPETAVILGATNQRAMQAGSDIELIRETNKREPIAVRLADWPLASLRKRGAIEGYHEDAGDRYFEDCYLAGFIPSNAIDYAKDKVDTSVTDQTPLFKLEAQDRFLKATKVNGPLIAPIVDAVCLEGRHPRHIVGHPFMRQNNRDKQAQILWTLNLGLENLAIHYGLKIS